MKALSQLAQRVLSAHAQEPQRVFYAVDLLGGMYRDSDIDRLDKAYQELAEAGLMQDTGVEVSFFGAPKHLFRVTDKGESSTSRHAA